MIWYWYWVDGHFTADPYLAKLLEARSKLLGGENAAAVVAVSTLERDDVAVAASDLKQFLKDFAPLRDVLERRDDTIAETIDANSRNLGDS